MIPHFSRWFAICLLLASCSLSGVAAPAIVLKLDDLTADETSQARFGAVFALLEKHEVKGGFGVIGQRLADDTEQDRSAAWAAIRRWAESGRVEIWHHGWVHSPTAFRGAELPSQIEALTLTCDLVREKCGVELVSFGAPHNYTDETTVAALNQFGRIRCWMFPSVKEGSTLALLTRRVNMEVDTGDIRFDHLKKNYEANRDADYMVLQGHPNRWDAEKLHEFDLIVAFLKAEGCTFVTPREAGERFGR